MPCMDNVRRQPLKRQNAATLCPLKYERCSIPSTAAIALSVKLLADHGSNPKAQISIGTVVAAITSITEDKLINPIQLIQK